MSAVAALVDELANELSDEEALSAIEKVISYYRDNAKKGERLGKMIERVGLDPFKEVIA